MGMMILWIDIRCAYLDEDGSAERRFESRIYVSSRRSIGALTCNIL